MHLAKTRRTSFILILTMTQPLIRRTDMAALPAVVPMASGMLAIEMLKSGCDMAREISLYQQKIAEIELQREHMLSQAALMRLQIKQHAKTAKRELNTLSSGFKNTLQYAEQLMRQLQQHVDQNHQALNQLMNQICQCQDPQLLTTLQHMWQSVQTTQHKTYTPRLNRPSKRIRNRSTRSVRNYANSTRIPLHLSMISAIILAHWVKHGLSA